MKSTILFISCEHAVNHIPKEYLDLFDREEAILNTALAMDLGSLEIASYLSHHLECEHTYPSVSRLLIDCNRHLHHPECFSAFSADLSDAIKKELVTKYYLTFREDTEQRIKNYIAQGNQVLHLATHSFPFSHHGVTSNAGIGLLYEPSRHAEKEVVRIWQSLLSHEKPTYLTRLNYPHPGKSDSFLHTLRKKYDERDYLGIELEVNQALVTDKESFDALLEVLRNSLQSLLRVLG